MARSENANGNGCGWHVGAFPSLDRRGLSLVSESHLRISENLPWFWENHLGIAAILLRIWPNQGRIAANLRRIAANQGRIAANQGRLAAILRRITAIQGRIAAILRRFWESHSWFCENQVRICERRVRAFPVPRSAGGTLECGSPLPLCGGRRSRGGPRASEGRLAR